MQEERLIRPARNGLRTVACALLVAAAPIAQAAFIERGGGVVYDTTTGLDWEQAPSTTGINWIDANAYVAALGLDGGGWRLPTMPELFTLYDEVSALTGCQNCTGDQGPFEDIELGYWTSSTYWGGQPGAMYVGFYRGPGFTAGLFQTSEAWVWANRAGVAIAAVPEPGGLALVGLALSGLVATRRRGGTRTRGGPEDAAPRAMAPSTAHRGSATS